ncbi:MULTISPECIES: biotin--[acetyl-CoA-carboxylase] ligase [Sphingobium]|uniref:biotin--[acetyl-CoA-carboxylase] ligase n=1 Tax=Sphingobium TaxID=165695 RepID=UPI000E74F944|nr:MULTISPECIES: biotin--[acetyl-CoA-carboxylase] ligase [Sphingobium]KAA9017910.1 biotin--[acetyl-CoA-carboxylase] ligase [Sphingobium limneticum]MBU0932539.1 biotin--[acetyl-CoA-carboxylase] ligase [Alphaproteobacteria bacterium]
MLRFVEETGSTNADMLALAEQGGADGSWLRAARQTGGKGRMGRAWESPDGNLYCSTLVRLQPTDPLPHTLALVAANAVHALVAPLCTGQARIKWPNDILVDGAKIAGILLERAGDAIVVGIGINVTGHPVGLDRPVTSLAAQGANDATAQALYDRLAQLFAHWLSIWRAQGLDPIRTHWLLNAHPTGTPMRVIQPDGGQVEGTFDTLDRQGMLILRLANGDSRAIHAGDIILN